MFETPKKVRDANATIQRIRDRQTPQTPTENEAILDSEDLRKARKIVRRHILKVMGLGIAIPTGLVAGAGLVYTAAMVLAFMIWAMLPEEEDIYIPQPGKSSSQNVASLQPDSISEAGEAADDKAVAAFERTKAESLTKVYQALMKAYSKESLEFASPGWISMVEEQAADYKHMLIDKLKQQNRNIPDESALWQPFNLIEGNIANPRKDFYQNVRDGNRIENLDEREDLNYFQYKFKLGQEDLAVENCHFDIHEQTLFLPATLIVPSDTKVATVLSKRAFFKIYQQLSVMHQLIEEVKIAKEEDIPVELFFEKLKSDYPTTVKKYLSAELFSLHTTFCLIDILSDDTLSKSRSVLHTNTTRQDLLRKLGMTDDIDISEIKRWLSLADKLHAGFCDDGWEIGANELGAGAEFFIKDGFTPMILDTLTDKIFIEITDRSVNFLLQRKAD